MAAYGRGHYALNKQAYIRRNSQRSRARSKELKERIWAYLAEQPCVDCGVTDPLVLEFDHVDPANKRDEIYRLVHHAYSWAAIEVEIAKCEVRCANCHRRRTALQFSWSRFDPTAPSPEWAGTRFSSGPRRPPQPGPLRTRLTPPATIAEGCRWCPWCGLVKPLEQFHWRNKASATRHSACGDCFNIYRREHYRMNRLQYIERNRRLLRERGREWLRRLRGYFVTHPCVDCGETDPVVLECDHRQPAIKRRSVSALARSGYPWPAVLNELATCQVRCANCHRRRTAVQFAWPKVMAIGIV